jgi:hypothetical protein
MPCMPRESLEHAIGVEISFLKHPSWLWREQTQDVAISLLCLKQGTNTALEFIYMLHFSKRSLGNGGNDRLD